MKYFSRIPLVLLLSLTIALSQTSQPQKPQDQVGPDDVVRITTELVQTDVIVVDSKDRVITDLTMADFELYDNGKKQDLKFLEFVSVDTGRRTEGTRPDAPASAVENENIKGVSAKEVKRVIAFVVDDLTIPIQDLPTVRNLLLDFVNNKMLDGDLVTIMRVVGGKGLLQQFTNDRTILKKAINGIKPVAHPLSTVGGPEPQRIENPRAADIVPENPIGDLPETEDRSEFFSPTDEVNQYSRGLSTLSTANYVIESLKEVPGHKNLVIISGGIPIFAANTDTSSPIFTNVTYLFQRLSDAALRAGVTINAMDPRGLSATRGAVSFTDTEGRSNYQAEIMGSRTGFGRGGSADQATLSPLLAGAGERLGLNTIAKLTGGVSVANTNDFGSGLDKILARSKGYYMLAYKPSEKFDRKYHKLEVKVKRPDVRVFHHEGYAAREDRPRSERTKEEQIVAAARSPLAKRDIEINPTVALKLLPEANKAAVEVHLMIDPKKLNFTQANGRYNTSLDVVGFVLDELGKQRGGFSETINLNLSQANYDQAQSGIIYTAAIDLPPGYFQLRTVVREASSGGLGTFSKYLEIPDLKRDSLALSSLFLFAVDKNNQPTPLTAIRNISKTQDVRYAVLIYNPKLKDGQPKLTSQLIISQGGKVLLREPEQPVEPIASSQHAKIGQFGISKMQPGRYVLTVVITDTLADKKKQTLSKSLDFTVVP